MKTGFQHSSVADISEVAAQDLNGLRKFSTTAMRRLLASKENFVVGARWSTLPIPD